MLPALRQRVLVAVVAVGSGLVLLAALGPLKASDTSSGIALADASASPAVAVGMLALALVPAMIAGLAIAVTGHPLAGPFAVGVALTILAAAGGPIDGFLLRSALPQRYGVLCIETAGWMAAIVGFLLLIRGARRAARRRQVPLLDPVRRRRDGDLCGVNGKTALGGLIAAAVGGIGAHTLIRSTDSGQVLTSMVLAFGVGACVAQMCVPRSGPLGILLAAPAVALFGYAFVILRPGPDTTSEILRQWFADDLPALALALPIQYVGAGLTGSTLGVGLGEYLNRAQSG